MPTLPPEVVTMFAVLCLAIPAATHAGPARAPDAMTLLARPYLLPVLGQEKVGGVSSYDRTGGNDDGFSGKYSFIRKEGDALIIADLKGPGILQRISTPTPKKEPLEFYFDGETEPRLRVPFDRLFLGEEMGFPAHLVGHGVGGFYSYAPIPFARSLKIAFRGPLMNFYQINYATYPEGAPIESWTPEYAKRIDAETSPLFKQGADLPALMLPPGSEAKTVRISKNLAPGSAIRVFDAKRGGRIVGLRISPASAIAGKDRAIVLKISFDGARQPAVLCPAGDFFGAFFGEPAMAGLLAGSRDNTGYCYLPMPYDRSAQIVLVDERTSGPPIPIEAEVVWAETPRRADEGRFYAVWTRENPTTIGEPFTWLRTEGRGRVVGATLQSQGADPGGTLFFEGDDQITIDGELAIHGTGSEDFFNGGWYDVPGRWDARRSLVFSGCLDYRKHLGRTGGWRFLLPDPVAFHKSIHFAIEHAPEKNNMVTDYVGVTYLYADRPPAGAGVLPDVPGRTVRDPDRISFATGWNIPIRSFSLERATLSKRVARVGDRDLRLLSFRASGVDVFGDHFLEPVCDTPASGQYRVSIEAIASPEAGSVQWTRDEMPVGSACDLNDPKTSVRTLVLGVGTFEQGPNPLMLKLRAGSAGTIGLDLVTITLERLSGGPNEGEDGR